MYDPNNAVDVADLKNEVALDPIGQGYASAPGTQELLDLLNVASLNSGGETGTPTLTADILIEVINAGEFASMTPGERDYIKMLMSDARLNNRPDIDWSKSALASIFPNPSATRTAFLALARPISRAEVLFGIDTFITRDMWIAARDS